MSESYRFEINEEGEGLIKVPGRYKLSRKAKARRTRAIKRIMYLSTLLYVIAALLYNYNIVINVTLK